MKWIKHDTDANMDAKLQEVLLDYGLEGYGLYWYCIELIAGKVDKDNVTFELEHDARIIARNVGSTAQKVEEMMRYFVNIGLFEDSQGVITCLKLAKRLDQSMTSNTQMREIIQNFKSHDAIMTESAKPMQDKNRLDKNRSLNNMSDSGESNAPQKKRLSVPYSEIESLYKEILVNTGEVMSMVNVQTLTKERKTRIKQYWTANGDKGLEGVKAYFQYLWNNRNNHSWLFGGGNRGWKADIEFIMREKTVTKARENTLGNWSEQQ